MLVLAPLIASALCAQSGLVLQPDPENVVAGRILGHWRLDTELTKRTGAKADLGEELEFRRDDALVGKVPATIATKLQGLRIYLSGVMVRRGTEQPFLVTVLQGNPYVIWFRERDGDPMGDAESFNVMLARGAEEAKDLLFTGGDTSKQAFAAYARKPDKGATTTVDGAIAEMVNLLRDGKHLEFLQTYADPDDVKKITASGGTVEALAEQFAKQHAGELLAILRSLQGQAATVSEDGTEATYKLPEGQQPSRGTIQFRRLDQRWYLRN